VVEVDWLDYAIVVAIVVAISGGAIGVGLFLKRRLASQDKRRVAEGGDDGTPIMMAAGVMHGKEADADGGNGGGGNGGSGNGGGNGGGGNGGGGGGGGGD
jgi:uncharacterized membrane protein YgcG